MACGETLSAGTYTVDKDIPAGDYFISCAGSDGSKLTLWGEAVDDYFSNGGEIYQNWVSPGNNGRIGKITFEAGNVVEIWGGSLDIEKYNGIDSNVIPAGIYTVGKDISAGDYSVSCAGENSAYINISTGGFGNQFYVEPGQNGSIGKLTLENNNIIKVYDAALVFTEYSESNAASANNMTISPGIYTIGEDIPAGVYSISAADKQDITSVNIGINFNLRSCPIDYSDYFYGVIFHKAVKPSYNESIGKITLENGNIIEIVNAAVDIKKYNGLNLESMDSFTVPSGMYIVGEDIPAGEYSVSCVGKNPATFHAWEDIAKDPNNIDNIILSEQVQPGETGKIGKVILKDGYAIEICDAALVFNEYNRFELRSGDSYTVPTGEIVIGEDIPAGDYTISCVGKEEALLTLWGKEKGDYSSNGGCIYSVWVTPGDNGKIGKLTLEEGNVVETSSGALSFSEYIGLDSNIVPSGVYMVGKDIPAGSYTVSCAGKDEVMLELWGKALQDYESNGGNLYQVWVEPGENGMIGKLTIEEGNVIEIQSGALIFEQYQGLSFE